MKEGIIQNVNGVDYMLFEFFTENESSVESLTDKTRKYKGILQKFDIKQSMFGTFKSAECMVLIPVEHALEFGG